LNVLIQKFTFPGNLLQTFIIH